MRISAGTSGFAFKEWKGPFYPKDLKDAEMLAYYAGQFPTVEINNTFYRMPKESVLADWASKVPDNFTFAVKASQRPSGEISELPSSKGVARKTAGFLSSTPRILMSDPVCGLRSS